MNASPKSNDNVMKIEPPLGVSSMERSLAYYVDGLGFTMAKKWVKEGKIRWCLLELGGAGLMLQELGKAGQNTGTPEPKKEGQTLLCFICKDALALYDGFKSRGITASEPQVGNAMWVTRLAAPDGYPMWFESRTDVTEGTKLSQVKPGSHPSNHGDAGKP